VAAVEQVAAQIGDERRPLGEAPLRRVARGGEGLGRFDRPHRQVIAAASRRQPEALAGEEIRLPQHLLHLGAAVPGVPRLLAASLVWLFDGYETYALIISIGVALRQLLEPSQYAQIPAYAGTVIALTLLGWGVGGLIGGVVADYLGRKRTMMLAILAYAITTGISAFAW